jgi:hypothetical protein
VKRKLLNDINHLTFITTDRDRLIAFYERGFEVRVRVPIERADEARELIAIREDGDDDDDETPVSRNREPGFFFAETPGIASLRERPKQSRFAT